MSHRQDDGSHHTQLHSIAEASIQLAALVPKMAEVAEAMDRRAQEQAKMAAEDDKMTAALAADLDAAVRELHSSSSQMEKALLTVRRIADHTKILSINASIEAARAGESGRAFSVVVEEVKQLSETTKETTASIETEVVGMQLRVNRISAAAGLGSSSKEMTIGAVTRQVAGMAYSAQNQLAGAQSLFGMGNRIERLAESLLLAVGRFRFEAHAKARDALGSALPGLVEAGTVKSQIENVLADLLSEHAYLELAYATDGTGRQIVDNICQTDRQITHDPKAFGSAWSDRPWFQEAMNSDGVCATDIYRSQATRDFCFTVAAAWRDPEGGILGVVAADVNFHRLLAPIEENPLLEQAERPNQSPPASDSKSGMKNMSGGNITIAMATGIEIKATAAAARFRKIPRIFLSEFFFRSAMKAGSEGWRLATHRASE